MNARIRLDQLLSGLEAASLSSPDTDFRTVQDLAAAATVREIVTDCLSRHGGEPFIPTSASERRLLLEIIARSQYGLPQEMRKMYGKGQKLSDAKVSELLRALLLRNAIAKRTRR